MNYGYFMRLFVTVGGKKQSWSNMLPELKVAYRLKAMKGILEKIFSSAHYKFALSVTGIQPRSSLGR